MAMQRAADVYMPGFNQDDYAPAEYRMVQAMSQAHTSGVADMGEFYCAATGTAHAELTFSILRVQRTLTLWGDDRLFPACSSDDRVQPRPGGRYPGPCAVCPENGVNCLPGYNLACVLLDDMQENGKPAMSDPEAPELFLLRVNGASVYAWRRLWSQLRVKTGAEPFRAAIILTSEERTNSRGTFYVMNPSILTLLDSEPLLVVQRLAQSFALQTSGLDEPPRATAPGALEAPDFKTATLAVPSSRPQPRRVTREECLEIVTICGELGVPSEIISDYVSAIGKTRLMEFDTAEWTVLKGWLYQEFTLSVAGSHSPADDLPF